MPSHSKALEGPATTTSQTNGRPEPRATGWHGILATIDRHWVAIVVVLYVVVHAALAMAYSPWRDVAQAWLIARDLKYTQIFMRLHFEGHPALWFLLLSIPAKLGLPFQTIFVISVGLMATSLALFLRYAPFPRWCKLVLGSGIAFVYVLPVIARSYALFPLLTILAAMAWPTRHEHPLRLAAPLFLLLQTHVLCMGFVGGVALVWLSEAVRTSVRESRVRVRELVALALILISLVMVYVELRTPSDAPQDVVKVAPFETLGSILEQGGLPNLGASILQSLETLQNSAVGEGLWSDSTYAIAAVVLLLLLVHVFARSPKAGFILVMALLWVLAVDILIYSISYFRQKVLAISAFVIFVCWVLYAEGTERKLRVPHVPEVLQRLANHGLLAYLMALAVISWLSYPRLLGTLDSYPTKQVASYVTTELPEDAVVILDNEVYQVAGTAYLPIGRFYNPLRGSYNTFSAWDATTYESFSASGDLLGAVAEVRETSASGDATPCYYLMGLPPSEDSSEYDEYLFLDASVRELEERSGVTLTEVARWQTGSDEDCVLYRIDV